MYANFIGEPILTVHTDGVNEWRTYWRYDLHGRVIMEADPSAVSNSFNPDSSGTDDGHGFKDIIGYDTVTGDASGIFDNVGFVHHYTYYTDEDVLATVSTDNSTSLEDAGGAVGYLAGTSIQRGDGGGNGVGGADLTEPVVQEDYSYYAHSDGDIVTVYPLATDKVYNNDNGTGAEETDYSYTFFTDSHTPVDDDHTPDGFG